MRTASVNVYQFGELSDKAKEKAREWYPSCIDSSDYDATEEDCKTIAKMLGIEEPTLYWSGFCSQGDGACLIGKWRSTDVDVEKLKEHAPKDEHLHNIAARIEAFKHEGDHDGDYLTCKITHRGHYYHERSTDFEFENEPEDFDSDEFEAAMIELNRWCYKQLEEQDRWLHSDENVDECIEANEYEFTEDGKLWTRE